MKKLIVALTLIAAPAYAGTHCTRIGSFTNCYDDDGGQSTTSHMGNYSNTYGTTGSGESFNRNCTRIGNTVNCY